MQFLNEKLLKKLLFRIKWSSFHQEHKERKFKSKIKTETRDFMLLLVNT